MDLRVATWNVWWRFGADWRGRQSLLSATLADLQADIIGLQEVWGTPSRTQADVLAGELGMYAAFAPESFPPPPQPPEHRDQAGTDLGVAVLSRWPFRRQAARRLPATRRHRPPALLVTVDHPLGPLHVCCATTEWEPDHADDHLAQTRALADLITHPSLDGPLPVLLVGDLNAPPGSEEMRPLLDVMVDAWTLGGGSPEAVTVPRTHPDAPVEAVKQIDQRVDYVLVRPGRPAGAVTVQSVHTAGEPDAEGRAASDHLAVVADLVLDDGRPR